MHKKMGNNIPPLIKQKLSKKEQEKYDKFKRNLQTANWNWNAWNLHIRRNMLEWVNTRSKIVRK